MPRRTPTRAAFRALVAAALVVAATGTTSLAREPEHGARPMKFNDAYPLITTPFLFEARDFYVRHFGFKPVFQSSWFVFLSAHEDSGARAPTIAFMHPDHPSGVPGPDSFSGLGMIWTVQVADVAAVHKALAASGAPIVYPLKDEDWGQRHFMTRDPSGMIIDIVQQTEPKAGYWERYPATR